MGSILEVPFLSSLDADLEGRQRKRGGGSYITVIEMVEGGYRYLGEVNAAYGSLGLHHSGRHPVDIPNSGSDELIGSLNHINEPIASPASRFKFSTGCLRIVISGKIIYISPVCYPRDRSN